MAKISRKGIRFICAWEGFRSCPYQDSVGVWTRGYGETKDINSRSECISKRNAKRNLRKRLNNDYIPHIPRRRRMRQQEIDALASFTYNLGPRAISDKSYSTLAKRLKSREGRSFKNRKRIYREELPKWCRAGGQVLEGLVKRRKAEVDIATKKDYSGRP